MQVVFTKDVQGVAHKGDVKNVANGYFRNFLVPQNAAVRANDAQIAHAEEVRKQAIVKKEKLAAQAQEIKEKIESATYSISSKVSEKNRLYGSITEVDVVKLVNENAKVELDKSNVKMKSHIKETGDHSVTIKLSDQVSAQITINVSAA